MIDQNKLPDDAIGEVCGIDGMGLKILCSAHNLAQETLRVWLNSRTLESPKMLLFD